MAANVGEERPSLLDGRIFCLITGASRGLGRCIATKFAEKLGDGSVMLIMARDRSALDKVKSEISSKNSKVRVVVKSVDLSTPDFDDYRNSITWALEQSTAIPDNFDEAMIIHNAGSLGDISKRSLEIKDPSEIRKYFDLNVNSPVLLNSAFCKVFPRDDIKRQVVVNISSLAAVQPFKSWSFYCSGKAARDMLFKVMAAEYPKMRILSYSPGPLKTDMTVRAREETADEELRQWFIDAYASDQMLTVEFSVDRLIALLETNKFQSGDHIDIRDQMPTTQK